MLCILCQKEIEDYTPALNRLKIDESREVDICETCIERFTQWQGKMIAKLFPTKALKRHFHGS